MHLHHPVTAVLVLLVIMAAGCVPTPIATTVPPTQLPTDAVTPSPSPTATDTPTPDPNIATFTSARLGIRFDHPISVDGQAVQVGEMGDRVYVTVGDLGLDGGQYVEVHLKAPADSLTEAITKQVLGGYSLEDCLPTVVAVPEHGLAWPASYVFARIELPRAPDDDMESLWQKADRCPQPEAAIGGIAYFLMDTAHPDRFLFFSIGQYYIPVRDMQPWQNTIEVLPSSTLLTSPDASAEVFIDDRSSGDRVMASYVNAINRREYVRAYSYWSEAGAASELPPFDEYVQGYEDTESVQLTIGDITSGAAMGQLYRSVPVVMRVQNTGDVHRVFAGCYIMRLTRPEFQEAPPFRPLAIERAVVTEADDGESEADLLATACEADEGDPAGELTTVDPTDISALQYVDNRSDAVSVVRSLMNAINSRQYARAYAYWQSEAGAPGGPPPYDQFRDGYAETEQVDLLIGRVTSDGAAGSLYYSVPAVLLVQTASGGEQTFHGCYVVRQVQPGVQGQPPFRPMGISSGSFELAPEGADPQDLLEDACP